MHNITFDIAPSIANFASVQNRKPARQVVWNHGRIQHSRANEETTFLLQLREMLLCQLNCCPSFGPMRLSTRKLQSMLSLTPIYQENHQVQLLPPGHTCLPAHSNARLYSVIWQFIAWFCVLAIPQAGSMAQTACCREVEGHPNNFIAGFALPQHYNSTTHEQVMQCHVACKWHMVSQTIATTRCT